MKLFVWNKISITTSDIFFSKSILRIAVLVHKKHMDKQNLAFLEILLKAKTKSIVESALHTAFRSLSSSESVPLRILDSFASELEVEDVQDVSQVSLNSGCE